MTTIIDGRGMEPPEPLQRALQALDELAVGDELLLLLYCQPHPLLAALKQRGCIWSEALLADGTREIRIQQAR
jgi:TusA-related sulfurtransferase